MKENPGQTNNTSTITHSRSNSDQESSTFKVWWPLFSIGFLLVAAGFAKYILHNAWVLGLSLDLVKAVGVIAVVVYAIHARLLSVDTSRMAQATIDMHKMERGAVIVSLFEGSAKLCDLPREAQNLTSKIHTKDKNIPIDEFKEVTSTVCPAVTCRVTNRTSRCIEASRVGFSAKHTGSPDGESILCDFSEVITVQAWSDSEIPLIVAPEGELVVTLETFHFLDGGLVQEGIIQSGSFKFDRIRPPKLHAATADD